LVRGTGSGVGAPGGWLGAAEDEGVANKDLLKPLLTSSLILPSLHRPTIETKLSCHSSMIPRERFAKHLKIIIQDYWLLQVAVKLCAYYIAVSIW